VRQRLLWRSTAWAVAAAVLTNDASAGWQTVPHRCSTDKLRQPQPRDRHRQHHRGTDDKIAGRISAEARRQGLQMSTGLFSSSWPVDSQRKVLLWLFFPLIPFGWSQSGSMRQHSWFEFGGFRRLIDSIEGHQLRNRTLFL